MFDNSAIGMVICDLNGKFLMVNNQFSIITGYSKEELYNMTFREITHPDDLDADINLMNELLSGTRKSYHLEKRYIKKDKNIIWVNLSASVVTDSDNKPEAFIGTIEEITEKKQIIEELTKSKSDYKNALKLLQSIQDAIPDLIGLQDIHHNIIQYNEAGYKMLNKTYDEVAGKKCYELIGRNKQCEVCSTAKAIATKKPARHEQYFPELDIWLDMRAYPIFDENNNIIYLVEHLRDITDIKKLELQLKDTIKNLEEAKLKAEESDNLKTAFLHNISHEIRTPLNGIIGFSDLLKSDPTTSEKKRKYADIIIRSGWQLSNIINDLVAIATIESGQEKIKKCTTHIQSLLNTIYANFCNKAANKGLAFYLKSEINDLQPVVTDETKLFQILSNLINNALKFTNNGYVEVGALVTDQKLQFYVKDTGIGIKPENFEKIFKRFGQVDSNPDSLYSGSGLGLSICKAYVELLGGQIWLQSELNKGSTFYFNIPLMFEDDEIKAKNTTHFQYTKKNRNTILIAEDDEINYLYLAEIFKELDMNVLHAKNGSEAIEICKQYDKIDIIFMDIKMPVVDGHEAIRQIKSFKPQIPIIAVSAYFDFKEKEKTKQLGCIDYFSKPVKREDIINKIHEINQNHF